MTELKQAALIVFRQNGRDIQDIMIFEDHNDAVDTFDAYQRAGIPAVMGAYTHYKRGETPDLPPVQKVMEL